MSPTGNPNLTPDQKATPMNTNTNEMRGVTGDELGNVEGGLNFGTILRNLFGSKTPAEQTATSPLSPSQRAEQVPLVNEPIHA
jgi:hypothetical protein